MIAVGHDDAGRAPAGDRRRATRVYAYRALLEHGDRVLAGSAATAMPTPPTPPTRSLRFDHRPRPSTSPSSANAAIPTIPAERYGGGCWRAPRSGGRGLDALLIGVGADLTSGYDAVALERLTMLVPRSRTAPR